MLTFVVRTELSGPALHRTLARIAALHQPPHHVVLIDSSPNGVPAEEVARFCEAHKTHLIRLDMAPGNGLSQAEMLRMAHPYTTPEAPYLLALQADDRVTDLPRLASCLAKDQPDLALLESAYWVTTPDQALMRADHSLWRSAASPDTLLPDPRRLAPHRNWFERHAKHWLTASSPFEAYAMALAACSAPRQITGPVLLHRDTAAPALPLWSVLAHVPPTLLPGALALAGEALETALPFEGPALVEAAQGLMRALPQSLHAPLRETPGPGGAFLDALHRGGFAGGMAQLALIAGTRHSARAAALSESYSALRDDLDLALPGPDYLRDLYRRIRGT